MKKQNLNLLTFIAVIALMLGGCGLSKMVKKANTITYDVVPNPLEMHGDSVAVTITGKFPAKYFNKKVIVDVTPTIIWDGGEKAMKTVTFQGEKAAGNGMVVPYTAGKTFTYSDKIPYVVGMEASDFTVKALGKKGKKEKAFDPYKIADGTIITPFMVQSDDKVLLGKDAFQRITTHTQEAIINYAKNKSIVRSGENKDQDIKDMNAFLKTAVENEKITPKSMSIAAYASPEGEIELNENLANERASTASKWQQGAMKKAKLSMGLDDAFYSLSGKGEDWDGFKDLVSKTDHPDKDLILRVLEKQSNPNQREAEIRNMSKTYTFLEKNILPQLRRSVMDLSYDVVGKSDEEITALAKTKPDSLTAEELLFAATLTTDLNEKLRIYKESEKIYSTDWRGANNVGYVYMMQNNLADAKVEFEKSNGIEENDVATNNLGVISRLKGDRVKGKELLSRAVGAGAEVNYNLGIIAIQDGQYDDAVSKMGSFVTFNFALAQMENGNNDGALKSIDASDSKADADGYYLKAIIGARTSNNDLLINNLKSAIGKDGSLKEKAKSDREFIKYWDNADFQAVVN